MIHDLSAYTELVSQAEGKNQLLNKQYEDVQKNLQSLESDKISLENSQAFIQLIAQKTQEQLQFHIEDVVQLALDTCFPGEYEFKIDFTIKGHRTIANLFFLSDGKPVSPIDASGGGVVDVASFALRIAAWSLGNSSRVIILDEPFRFLSRDLQPLAGQILKTISQKLDIQFIMVTHNPDIIDSSDRVFEVEKKNGKSLITMRETV
jgi:DNA repair exonuclease SbcCD ATPase subunit